MIMTKDKLELLKQSFKVKTIKYDRIINYIHDEKTGIDVSYGIHNDTFVIAFQKTDRHFIDWLTNFIFVLRKNPYLVSKRSKVKMHSGYANAYMNIRDGLHLDYIKNHKEKVLVIGYSQGGGLAQICALDFQYIFNPTLEVITGGSPKVFNKAGVASFNKRVPNSIRYTYGGDLVPKLPFDFLGFKHVDTHFHFGGNEKGIHFMDHDPSIGLWAEIEKYMELSNDNK